MKKRYLIILFIFLMSLASSCASSNIRDANKAARKRYKGYENNCHCQIEIIHTLENQKGS